MNKLRWIRAPRSAAPVATVPAAGVPRGLLLGAIVTALLTGALTGLAGGVLAGAAVLLLALMSVAVFNFRYGVLCALLLLPLSATRLIPRELGGIKGLNPLNALLAVSALALFLQWALKPGKLILPALPRQLLWYLGAIVVAGVLGARHASQIPPYYELIHVVSFNSAGGYLRDVLFKPLVLVLTAYLFGVTLANADKPQRHLVALFASALTLPLVVVAFIALSGVPLSKLASAQSRTFLSFLGIHANELGLMFNLAYALALFSALKAQGTATRAVLWGVAGLLSMSVVLTFSRGAFLGLLTITAFFLFKRRQFGLLAAAVALTPLVYLLLPEAVIERASTGLGNHDVSAISAGRVGDIWLPLLPELWKNPVIGQGLSSVLWSDAARRGTMLPVGHPHSAYLGLFLDFGVAGAVVIVLFFLHMWRTFSQTQQVLAGTVWEGFFQGGMACVLALLVQGFTDDRVTPTAPQIFLWCAYGAALGMAARLQRQQQAAEPSVPAAQAQGAR